MLCPPPAEQARLRLVKHKPKPIFPSASVGSAKHGPTAAAAMLFEALSVHNLLPLTPGEPGADPRFRQALPGPPPTGKNARRTQPTHVCYSVHFGAAERPAADAVLAFTRATRRRLQCEPQMMDHANGTYFLSASVPPSWRPAHCLSVAPGRRAGILQPVLTT